MNKKLLAILVVMAILLVGGVYWINKDRDYSRTGVNPDTPFTATSGDSDKDIDTDIENSQLNVIDEDLKALDSDIEQL